VESYKPKLMSWSSLKQLIFEILDDRITNAPEISGSVNTSVLGLDEHLLIFML